MWVCFWVLYDLLATDPNVPFYQVYTVHQPLEALKAGAAHPPNSLLSKNLFGSSGSSVCLATF